MEQPTPERSRPSSSRPPLGRRGDGGRERVTLLVICVGRQQATIDADPVLAVDLIVVRPGKGAEPLATSLRVPRGVASALQAGVRLPAELSASDPSVLDVEWSAI